MTQTSVQTSEWHSLIGKARDECDCGIEKIADQVHQNFLAVAARDLTAGIQSKIGPSDVVQTSLTEARKDTRNFCGAAQSKIRIWINRIVIYNLTDEAKRYCLTGSGDLRLEMDLKNEHSACNVMHPKIAKRFHTSQKGGPATVDSRRRQLGHCDGAV